MLSRLIKNSKVSLRTMLEALRILIKAQTSWLMELLSLEINETVTSSKTSEEMREETTSEGIKMITRTGGGLSRVKELR